MLQLFCLPQRTPSPARAAHAPSQAVAPCSHRSCTARPRTPDAGLSGQHFGGIATLLGSGPGPNTSGMASENQDTNFHVSR